MNQIVALIVGGTLGCIVGNLIGIGILVLIHPIMERFLSEHN